MSASQRAKGQRGERAAYHLLWEQLGDIVERRDLSQTRDGGGDIRIPAARVVVEVKRVQARAVPTWLRQARQSANMEGAGWAGVVMWRRNGEPWTLFGGTDRDYWAWTVDNFCDWVRGRLG
jgi:hypothetical protein